MHRHSNILHAVWKSTNILALLYVHLKNDVFSFSLPSPLYQGVVDVCCAFQPLFSLILHLNKEPYGIICFSFISSKGVLPL